MVNVGRESRGEHPADKERGSEMQEEFICCGRAGDAIAQNKYDYTELFPMFVCLCTSFSATIARLCPLLSGTVDYKDKRTEHSVSDGRRMALFS